jgi:hypothetical protein
MNPTNIYNSLENKIWPFISYATESLLSLTTPDSVENKEILTKKEIEKYKRDFEEKK